jgi:hypothetical protein
MMPELNVETVHTVEDIDVNQWDNVIKQSRTGSRKQSASFTRAVEEGTPSTPAHTIVKKDGNITGVLPGRLRSLPAGKKYLSTSTPIVTSNEKETVKRLVRHIESFLKEKNIAYHIIKTSRPSNIRYNTYLEDNGYRSSIYSCKHLLSLRGSIEEIKSGMSNSRRKNFQKLYENRSIELVNPESKDMIEFYDDFKKFQRRPEVSSRNIDYFQKLAEVDEVSLARYREGGKVVGQNLYLQDEENSCIHYLLSGVKEDYREKKALETVHAHMIRKAKKDGIEKYSFGSNKGDFRDGIFKFKEQYGAEPLPQLKWKKANPSKRNKLYLKLLRAARGVQE